MTGGAQGIGAAIASKVLAEGGLVTAVDRKGGLDQSAASLDDLSGLCLQMSGVTDATAVGLAHTAAVNAFGLTRLCS